MDICNIQLRLRGCCHVVRQVRHNQPQPRSFVGGCNTGGNLDCYGSSVPGVEVWSKSFGKHHCWCTEHCSHSRVTVGCNARSLLHILRSHRNSVYITNRLVRSEVEKLEPRTFPQYLPTSRALQEV